MGVFNDAGELQEIVGTVTASGTYDGQPVIFLGKESYLLSSVMAVGRLPESVSADPIPETDNNTNSDTTVDSGDMDDADSSDSVEV